MYTHTYIHIWVYVIRKRTDPIVKFYFVCNMDKKYNKQ